MYPTIFGWYHVYKDGSRIFVPRPSAQRTASLPISTGVGKNKQNCSRLRSGSLNPFRPGILFYSTFTPSVLATLIKLTNPIKVYHNAELERREILKENTGRIGIYLWFNNITNKFYVGSSKNLSSRFRSYFNPAFLNRAKNSNMLISRSLVKSGYSAFSLIILEYCEESFLTNREQFWLDTLKPDYNVLKLAYRSTGYNHTEETKRLMSELARLRNHSAETKAKISQALKGENNPFFNQHHSIATIKKIQAANSTSLPEGPRGASPPGEFISIMILKLSSLFSRLFRVLLRLSKLIIVRWQTR